MPMHFRQKQGLIKHTGIDKSAMYCWSSIYLGRSPWESTRSIPLRMKRSGYVGIVIQKLKESFHILLVGLILLELMYCVSLGVVVVRDIFGSYLIDLYLHQTPSEF